MKREEMLLDNASADQVLLDDPLQDLRTARMIPRSFGIHDCDGSLRADPQAVGFRSEHTALPAQAQFIQTALEILPGSKAIFARTAFGLRLIAAKEDMPLRLWNADRLHDFLKFRRHDVVSLASLLDVARRPTRPMSPSPHFMRENRGCPRNQGKQSPNGEMQIRTLCALAYGAFKDHA